jgi:hypothetical protein
LSLSAGWVVAPFLFAILRSSHQVTFCLGFDTARRRLGSCWVGVMCDLIFAILYRSSVQQPFLETSLAYSLSHISPSSRSCFRVFLLAFNYRARGPEDTSDPDMTSPRSLPEKGEKLFQKTVECTRTWVVHHL